MPYSISEHCDYQQQIHSRPKIGFYESLFI